MSCKINIIEEEEEKKKSAVDKFLFRRAILLARPIGHAKNMGAQNHTARPIETQLETLLFALCYLNSNFTFIFNLQKFSQ